MRDPEYTYEKVRRISCENGATFVPVCETCGRFVKADNTILFNGLDELSPNPNATCKHCGRTHMLFEGYV